MLKENWGTGKNGFLIKKTCNFRGNHVFFANLWKFVSAKFMFFSFPRRLIHAKFLSEMIFSVASLNRIVLSMILLNRIWMTYTVWNVSRYGVFSGPYLDTFHAVGIVNNGRYEYFINVVWKITFNNSSFIY